MLLAIFGIKAWISNYIHVKQWDVITCPWYNFNSSFSKPLLTWCHGWVITSQMIQLNDREFLWWWVNIDSGNGLLTQFYHIVHLTMKDTSHSNFIARKCIWKCLQKSYHFVLASICLYKSFQFYSIQMFNPVCLFVFICVSSSTREIWPYSRMRIPELSMKTSLISELLYPV